MNNCKWCFNDTIEEVSNYEHEDVLTNEIVVHDVKLCTTCGAIYYKEDEYNVCEFPVREQKFTFVHQVNDYDIALEKKIKGKEYAKI